MPRRGRGRGERSQNKANTDQPASTQTKPFPVTAPVPIYLDRAEQLRQAVDSWRSYRNDNTDLQSSITSRVNQPLGSYNTNAANSAQSGLNIHAPTFTPYQPLRVSNDARERQVLHQALQTSQLSAPRYPLRSRQSGQANPRSGGVPDNSERFLDQPARVNRSWIHSRNPTSADHPIQSIETDSLSIGLSTTFVPSSLPPRFADRRSYSRTPDNVVPPNPPKTSSKYLKRAGNAPEKIDSPKKLLVILDLNGTLLVRPDGRSNPTNFKLRPGVTPLLDYLFANHVVMVYSSARPENVNVIVNKFFHPTQRVQIAAIWARNKLDLNKVQYNAKVQVYKKLDKIWADPTIQASAEPGQKWDQTNTVLVDDSHLKALAQPHNLVQVTEFKNNAPREGGEVLRTWQLQEMAILESLEQKLEELKWQVDVSRLIREWQSGKRQAPGVVDETIDQKTHETVHQQPLRELSPTPSLSKANSTTETAQFTYPSPQSPRSFSTKELESKDAGEPSSALDILEAEINQGLKNTRLSDSIGRRSESPIDETVFAELLSGGGSESLKAKESTKGSSVDIPATPESLDG